MDFKTNKGIRILSIYEKLQSGKTVSKESLAEEYGVSPKSIQRDIDTLREYLNQTGSAGTKIEYSRKLNGYYMPDTKEIQQINSEITELCRRIYNSGVVNKATFEELMTAHINAFVPESKKDEMHKYISVNILSNENENENE